MSEPGIADLMTVSEAIAVIDAAEVRPRVVAAALGEAQGLRLAEEIRADRDHPPFDKSLMDGYAVRAADVRAAEAAAPIELAVAGKVAAGREAADPVREGCAVAVMTGAPIPPGADAVVPVEDARSRGGGFAAPGSRVLIERAISPGKYIALRGSDVRRGAAVLSSGALMGPAQVAVAASVGAAVVKVFDRPRVAVLGTGDELAPFDATPGPAQVRNSNSPMLVALLRRLDCAVRDLGVVADDPAAIRSAIADGLRDDVLFVTGGMSMGEYDYVPRLLAEMGGELRITKLRIKPGKPFVMAAMPGGKYVFGLPGNPVSAYVCTVRLASRLLARMGGWESEDDVHTAPLASPLPANGPREFYQPAVMEGGRVGPLAWKGSADIFTLAKADVLIVRGENESALAEGANVRVMKII